MNATDTTNTLVNFPVEISILICGNHGIGKSQVVAQAAEKLGVPCIDFRLSQNDVGDLKGMPWHINGRTMFAPPEFMPITKDDAEKIKELLGLAEDISLGTYGDKGILFLDEINRANREVQQAAFELVLDRRLNMRALPKGWRVVAAINADSDIYTVNAMEPAFLSRFFKIDFKPTQQEFFKFADKVGMHPAVTEFLRRNPEFLDPNTEMLKEAAAESAKKVHDRRAWHLFSNVINDMEKKHEDGALPKPFLGKDKEVLEYLTQVAYGFVGVTAGIKFRRFIETDYQALDANTIFNKFDKAVESQLKAIVEGGRIPELAGYNELLIEYAKKKVKSSFSATQMKNLSDYLGMMPKEIVAGFWKKFNAECVSLSEQWYKSEGRNRDIILKALSKPKNK